MRWAGPSRAEPSRARLDLALRLFFPSRGGGGFIGRPSHPALQGGAGGDSNVWVGWVGGGAWVPH